MAQELGPGGTGAGAILHHYLCAYVGPLADFTEASGLICPKCGRGLAPEGDDWEVIATAAPERAGRAGRAGA